MQPKFNVKMADSKVVAGYDGNSDGENSISIKLNLGEAFQELMQKGEAKIEVKSLSIKREGSKMIAVLDTDKDGEAVLECELDALEALDEAGIFKL